MTQTLFEFPVGGFYDEKGVIDVRPGIMFALVPAMGALLQGFVVPFLVLLNETLQTDVSADLESQMVALQEQKEPRSKNSCFLVLSIPFWVLNNRSTVRHHPK